MPASAPPIGGDESHVNTLMMDHDETGDIPAHIALGSIENMEPGSLMNLLEQLRGEPTGTLELEPVNQAPATSPAKNPGQ